MDRRPLRGSMGRGQALALEGLLEVRRGTMEDIDRLKDRFIFGADVPETVSPFGKVQSISSVYFPQFSTLANDLDEAATEYRRWMIGAGEKRLNKDPTHIGGFVEAYEPYKRKRNALLDALQKFARKHFK